MVTKWHLTFYAIRAKYLGAVIPTPFYMNKGLRELPAQMGIDNDEKIEGLKELTGLLHKTDTKAIAHLNHPGRMVNPIIPGNYFISATDKPCENGGTIPNRMTQKDIKAVIRLFSESAVRVQKAGFDILELQFGHGYLVAQFLSPFVNDREDEYGGGFEQSVRFPLEILSAVKAAVNLPVIIRISGDEMIPNGIILPEMEEFARLLEKAGAAAIHVSAGTVCSAPPWFFQHMFVPKGKSWAMARQVKRRIKIPVIAVAVVGDSVNSEISATSGRAPYFLVFNENGDFLKVLKNPALSLEHRASTVIINLLL